MKEYTCKHVYDANLFVQQRIQVVLYKLDFSHIFDARTSFKNYIHTILSFVLEQVHADNKRQIFGLQLPLLPLLHP